ncbi:MAG TPA: TRAM domain-containing protein, partial [Candidatus Bathyarchaeota archaeon]|nr:TRAM domain-containing protein [Candidatus Bathyarchaeota archaeon]
GEILVTEHGKRSTKVGRNYVYKAIAVKTDAPLGSFVNVRVKKSGVGYLVADEIRN